LRVSPSVRLGAQKKQANWVRLVHHLLAASLTLDKDGRSPRT
jgi:hypothetical protein